MNKIIYVFLALIISIQSVSASDEIYITSENKLSKNDIFSVLFLDIPGTNVIEKNNISWIYTDNFEYMINATTGSIISKIAIKGIIDQVATDNFIWLQTEDTLYKLNALSGEILEKKIYKAHISKIFAPTPSSIISNSYEITNNNPVLNWTDEQETPTNCSQNIHQGYLSLNCTDNIHESNIQLHPSRIEYWVDGTLRTSVDDVAVVYNVPLQANAPVNFFNTLDLDGSDITNVGMLQATYVNSPTIVTLNTTKVNKSGDTMTRKLTITDTVDENILALNPSHGYPVTIGSYGTYSVMAGSGSNWGVFGTYISGDSVQRLTFGLDSGKPMISFGAGGSSTRDLFLERTTNSTLALTNITYGGANLVVTGNITSGRKLNLSQAGYGIQMKSPDGTVYCTTVSNLGVLVTVSGQCD